MTEPALDDDAVPDNAIVIDHGIGIEDAVAADGGSLADVYAGVENGIFANLGGGFDVSLWVDAGVGVAAMAMKNFDGLHECEVGIGGAEERDAIAADVLAGDDGGGAGGGQEFFVFGVGEDGDLAGARVFEGLDAGDGRGAVADEGCADFLGQFGDGHVRGHLGGHVAAFA